MNNSKEYDNTIFRSKETRNRIGLYRPYGFFFSKVIFLVSEHWNSSELHEIVFSAALVWDEIQFVWHTCNLVYIPEKSEECFWTRNVDRQDTTDVWCIYFDFANTHITILVRNYEPAMEKFTADYIIRALILPGTYYEST